MENLKINTGDAITIKAQGKKITGKVISAYYYKNDGGWYIELEDASGEYYYYKEQYDGGEIISIEPQKERAFDVGDKIYHFVDDTGEMGILYVIDDETNEYYTELLNGGSLDIFKVESNKLHEGLEHFNKRLEESTQDYDILNTNGRKYKVLDYRGQWMLIKEVYSKRNYTEYVVIWGLNADQDSWAQGAYFQDLEQAREYLEFKAPKEAAK